MAADFTAANQIVAISGFTATYTSVSMSAWVYLDGYGGGGGGGLGRIINKGSSSDTYSMYVGTNVLRWTGEFSTSPGVWQSPANTILTGTLYHVAVTWVSTAEPIMYINGASVTVTESNSPSGTFPSGDTDPYNIGNRGGDLARNFDGRIEDARVYNVILTPEEILTIYSSRGLDGIVRGLQGRWIMNEGVAGANLGTVVDISSGAHNGTQSNNPVYAVDFIRGIKRRY